MWRMTLGTGALASMAVLGAVALFGNEDSSSPALAAPQRADTGKVYAQDAYLRAGSSAELLTASSVRVKVRCTEGRFSLVRVTARSQSTSAVVSSTGGDVLQPQMEPGRPLTVPLRTPGIQTWTLAPISEGGAQPTVLTVGISELEPSDVYDCAVLAEATVGAAGGTITG